MPPHGDPKQGDEHLLQVAISGESGRVVGVSELGAGTEGLRYTNLDHFIYHQVHYISRGRILLKTIINTLFIRYMDKFY